MNYTEEELEEAKAYLKDRLRNQRSMEKDIENLLAIYAAYLLSALFSKASDEDIQTLINSLVEQLLSDCETLAVDTHDRKDAIIAYMTGERNGDTLEGRIRKRAETFFNEVFAVYLAGTLLGKGQEVLLKSIKESLKRPWENEVLEEAREKQANGEISNEYDFVEPHYGRGNATSSLLAIERALSYAVADAWTYWQWLDKIDGGAVGYYVLRGSSFPCDLCDSHTGIFFDVNDKDSLPPYHTNCVCFAVYTKVPRL
jgi:hypothetical protein